MQQLCTLRAFLASLDPQVLGQAVTYEIGATDVVSRRVCGFSAPHYLARPWAITLGPPSRSAADIVGVPFTESISDDQNEAVGVLQWGTGGFQNSIEIDWRQGGIYTVVGSSIQVSCRMPVPGTIRLTIGASITPCNYQVPNNATRTLVSDGAVAFGAAQLFAIPPGAHRVQFMGFRGNPATDIPYSFEFFRSDGTKVADGDVGVSPNRTGWDQAVPIPVPFQAGFVEFTNLSANTNLNGVQAIFELAF